MLGSKAHHDPTRREGISVPISFLSGAQENWASPPLLAYASVSPSIKKKSWSFLVSLLGCPGTHWEKDGKASTHAKEERTVCAHSGLASSSLKGGKTKTFLGAPFFKLSLVLSEVLVLKEGKKGGPQTGNHRLTP